MTVDLANYLLGLEKYVWHNNNIAHSYSLNLGYPMNVRLMLSAPNDLDQNLLIDIKESKKKSLKISLHHQDYSTQNGLLRLDYHSRHLNPSIILETVPEKFKPFAGQWLDAYPGHLHYVVDGYRPLAWAIPLDYDDFPVKNLQSREDYITLLMTFFERINLKTLFRYTQQMRLL